MRMSVVFVSIALAAAPVWASSGSGPAAPIGVRPAPAPQGGERPDGSLNITALSEARDPNASFGQLTAAQLRQMALVDPAGNKVGDVAAVLADPSGKIVAVSVETGGFLGMGERETVLALDRLEIRDERSLRTAMSSEQLRSLPAWRGHSERGNANPVKKSPEPQRQ